MSNISLYQVGKSISDLAERVYPNRSSPLTCKELLQLCHRHSEWKYVVEPYTEEQVEQMLRNMPTETFYGFSPEKCCLLIQYTIMYGLCGMSKDRRPLDNLLADACALDIKELEMIVDDLNEAAEYDLKDFKVNEWNLTPKRIQESISFIQQHTFPYIVQLDDGTDIQPEQVSLVLFAMLGCDKLWREDIKNLAPEHKSVAFSKNAEFRHFICSDLLPRTLTLSCFTGFIVTMLLAIAGWEFAPWITLAFFVTFVSTSEWIEKNPFLTLKERVESELPDMPNTTEYLINHPLSRSMNKVDCSKSRQKNKQYISDNCPALDWAY